MITSILNHFIYSPDSTSAPIDFTPAQLDLEYEDVSFRTADGVTLSGWYIFSNNPHHSLLYCHGNGGNCRDWANIAPEFVAQGCNIFIFDYRGFGKSEGHPSEKGLYFDGEAAWTWLKSRANVDGIPASILGKSLGSAVAVHVASMDKPRSLILDSAFTSMREVIALNAPWLPKIIIPRVFESFDRIPLVTCPTLVICGGKDELVPNVQSLRIYKALRSPKALSVIEEAGHNNIDTFGRYYHWVTDFLKDPLGLITKTKMDCLEIEESLSQKYESAF